MAKVDLELVKLVLQRNDVDIRKVAEIIEEINFEVANQVDEERAPIVKKQFVMLLSDPHGELTGKDFTGWVLQIPEEDSPYTTVERVIKGTYEYNASPRGRRIPVKSIGEACEVVSSRFFKEANVWVKTKEPILCITTDNKIPREAKELA